MSELTALLKKKEVRRMLAKPLSSFGYYNFIKSLTKAAIGSIGNEESMLRRLLPELWKNLGLRTAVISDAGSVSFEEMTNRALRLANSFYEFGLREGDYVAILLSNEQAWVDTYLACLLSGLNMPMINTHLKPEELTECINRCRPKVLVFSGSFLEVIKQIEPELDPVPELICSGSEGLPDHYTSLGFIVRDISPTLPPGGFSPLPQKPFSGGSTGVPKFITEEGAQDLTNPRMKGMDEASLDSLLATLAAGFARLELWSIQGQIISLIPGPLYHGGPQLALLPLVFGGTVIPMLKFDVERFLELIEKERVNFTFVVPTMLERILKLPQGIKGKYDLSSMQALYCAAAPCPDYVKKETNAYFREQGATRNVFNEYYGSTEAFFISMLSAKDYEGNPERYKSVGQPSGSECRIYNPEERRWCKPGEVGHVLVRNYRMYRVQYGGSDEIESAFIEVDGLYWYDDGCLGYLDEDNYLYLTSRSKDMLICGGVNIFPTEIENAMKSHPGILDVAVVKVPDDDLGEVPGALIQTMDGREIPKEELIHHCKEQGLYGFKLPREIKFIEELPKDLAGKIRKGDLEKEFTGEDPGEHA